MKEHLTVRNAFIAAFLAFGIAACFVPGPDGYGKAATLIAITGFFVL